MNSGAISALVREGIRSSKLVTDKSINGFNNGAHT